MVIQKEGYEMWTSNYKLVCLYLQVGAGEKKNIKLFFFISLRELLKISGGYYCNRDVGVKIFVSISQVKIPDFYFEGFQIMSLNLAD